MHIWGLSKTLKFSLLLFETYFYESNSYSLWELWEVQKNLEHKIKLP